MNPIAAIKTTFAKSLQFSGRSTRSEYWWFFGFVLLANWGAVALDTIVFDIYEFGAPMKWISIAGLVTIVTLLPILAIGWRRLQDTKIHGGIYILLTAIAYAGFFLSVSAIEYLSYAASLVSIVLCIRQSSLGSNRFGPNPNEVLP